MLQYNAETDVDSGLTLLYGPDSTPTAPEFAPISILPSFASQDSDAPTLPAGTTPLVIGARFWVRRNHMPLLCSAFLIAGTVFGALGIHMLAFGWDTVSNVLLSLSL